MYPWIYAELLAYFPRESIVLEYVANIVTVTDTTVSNIHRWQYTHKLKA